MEISTLKNNGRLVNVFFNLLVLGVHARDSRDLGNLESLQKKIEEMLEEADRQGSVLEYSRETLLEARFAVVAFVDEMILQSGWDKKSQWASHLLQYRYFQTQSAGEEFFYRLTKLRTKLPVNVDLLEVFHACMVLGFEGKYKLEGREKLKDVTHDTFREIQGLRGECLPFSPSAERHEEVLDMVKQEVPVWVVVACSLAIVFFSYVGMSVLIHQESEETLGQISELVQAAKP